MPRRHVDGKQYGPLLNVEEAIAVYTCGSRFLEGTPIPPSRFDHQATYLDFWLRLVGVRDLRSVIDGGQVRPTYIAQTLLGELL
jgi:hypothetical protein